MNSKDKIKLFQEQTVRTRWDEEQEKWYFSVVDVVAVLTEHKSYQGARNYWKVLKHRLVKEAGQLVTICNQLKMPATDGKLRIENYFSLFNLDVLTMLTNNFMSSMFFVN